MYRAADEAAFFMYTYVHICIYYVYNYYTGISGLFDQLDRTIPFVSQRIHIFDRRRYRLPTASISIYCYSSLNSHYSDQCVDLKSIYLPFILAGHLLIT